MARLELDEVTKVFDTKAETIVAVEELDLDIDDGEFIVVVGPSGCGKSTTLRMIAGLETVTDGEIRLGGERINEKSPKDRDIAMVFQSYALYPHKTVHQNMAYGLHLSTDLDDEEIDRRVQEAANMMGIEDLLEKKPRRSPAASSSASPLAGRSSANPRCSCSTNRSRTSTRSSASTCGPKSRGSTPRSASRRCTSRTTRRKR